MTSQEHLLQAIPDCAIFCKYENTHIHLISANYLEEHNTCVNITRASSPPHSFHIIFRSNKYLVGYARDAHRNACRSSLKSIVKTFRPVWKPKWRDNFLQNFVAPKCYENPFSGSRVFPCDDTDGAKTRTRQTIEYLADLLILLVSLDSKTHD